MKKRTQKSLKALVKLLGEYYPLLKVLEITESELVYKMGARGYFTPRINRKSLKGLDQRSDEEVVELMGMTYYTGLEYITHNPKPRGGHSETETTK